MPVVTNMAVTQNCDRMKRHICVVFFIRECIVLGTGAMWRSTKRL